MKIQIVRLAGALVATLACSALATAQYSEKFDGYAAGSSIVGQGGWQQWENSTVGANDNAVTAGPAHSAPNSLATWRDTDAIQDWGVNQPGTYVTGQWRHTTWVYVPNTTTDVQWWVFLSDYHHGCSAATPNPPPACFWTAQASVDPTVPEFNAQVGPSLCTGLAQTTGLTAPLTFDTWHEIALEVDLDTTPAKAQLYWDGAALGDPFDYSEGVSTGTGPSALDTLDLYANNNVSTNPVYWDDISIAASSTGNVPPCLGTATTFCTAGTSSNGCVPSINYLGSPSAAHTTGFQIGCNQVEINKQGLLFYGISQSFTPVPWGSGGNSFLCVKAPTQRTPNQNSNGTLACSGTFSLLWSGAGSYMQNTPSAVGNPLFSGQSFDGQWWYRDPPAVKTTNLSDGLRWIMAP
jgi:hypothetical protein